jgi:hypothetical protein
MQVIFRGTYWLRFWSQLQHDEKTRELLRRTSSPLDIVALEIANLGWKHNNRLI